MHRPYNLYQTNAPPINFNVAYWKHRILHRTSDSDNHVDSCKLAKDILAMVAVTVICVPHAMVDPVGVPSC